MIPIAASAPLANSADLGRTTQAFGGPMMMIFFIVMVCFLAAIPFFSVLNAWLVDRSMDTFVALGLLAAILLTLMAMMAVWGTMLTWVLLLALLGVNFALPMVSGAADKLHDRQMTSADLEKYQAMIERDPRNAAAHAYLGDALMKVGRYADAAASYQRVIEIMPKDSQTEKYKLQRAQAKMQGHQDAIDICPGCRAEVTPGLIRCPECQHFMKMSYFLQELQREGRPAIGVMVGGGIAGMALESLLHIRLGGLICMASLIIGALMLAKAMKEV